MLYRNSDILLLTVAAHLNQVNATFWVDAREIVVLLLLLVFLRGLSDFINICFKHKMEIHMNI